MYVQRSFLFTADHNLAKMAAGIQKLQCLLCLVEGELPVHHRLDLVLLVEPDHLLEPVLGSVDNTLQSHVSSQGKHVHVRPVVRFIDLAGEVSDAVDKTAEGDAVEALFQGLSSAGFEHNVGTVVVGYFHDGLFPVGVLAVVDCVVGPELLGLGEFLVGGRGDDHCLCQSTS